MNPAIWTPGPLELAIIAIVALLIFGRRLPDVARSIGKSIVEFKRGLRDVEDEIETQSRLDESRRSQLEDDSRRTRREEEPDEPHEAASTPDSSKQHSKQSR